MQDEKKKATLRCDRTTLSSLVLTTLRTKGIPMVLLGGDLIRGTVFDMMDHPENSIDESIGRAYFFSRLPGIDCREMSEADVDEGYELIYEAIEASSIKNIPWIPFSEDNALQKKMVIVQRELEVIALDVKRAFCHSIMVKFFEKHKFSFDSSFGEAIIKDMVFKKLVADESTKQCMYEYAFRKEFGNDEKATYSQIRLRIFHELKNYCKRHRKTPYQIACSIVDQIYEERSVA